MCTISGICAKKVEEDPKNPRYIHNERGFGHRFQVDG